LPAFVRADRAGDHEETDMSRFESYDTPTQSRRSISAVAMPAPLSELQEMELAAEALEILGNEELEEFVGNVLGSVAAGAGAAIRPAVARQLGGILAGVAPAGLPAGRALSSLTTPGPGTVVGSKLGWMIDRVLELELEGMDREDAALERARRYVGLVTTSARHAALAPRGAPPHLVVQSALGQALAEHVPDLLERALAGELSPYQKIPDSEKVGPGKVFTESQKRAIIDMNKKRNVKRGLGPVVTSDDPKWDPYVQLKAADPAMWTIDHIVPKSLGGTNSYKNARVISFAYNRLLSTKTDVSKVKAGLQARPGKREQPWTGLGKQAWEELLRGGKAKA
jgi:hypothetical protein